MPIPNAYRKYRIVIFHICAWVVYIFMGTLNKIALHPKEPINVPDIIFTHLPSVYVFYGSGFIFFKFISKKQFLYLTLAAVVFFASYVGIIYINSYYVAPLLNNGATNPHVPMGIFLIQCLWIFFVYTYFSFGYYLAMQAIRKEKQLRLIEREKLQAEQGKLEAEYAFLRTQINPHFLHNILNFFYAKSLECSKELSDGILTLSEIMRYSLSGGEDQRGTVLLSKEVEHLQKVIKINQLRFSNRIQVNFVINGDIESIRIIPLVLITLTENAFKHGDLTNAEYPITIKVDVDNDTKELRFLIFNKKRKGPKEIGHGIGLENVRKRLHRAYEDNFKLNIKDEADFYTAELIKYSTT